MEYYRNYLREGEGKELHTFKEGFIVHSDYEEGGTFIDVIYVHPDYRDSVAAVRHTVDLLIDIKKYLNPVFCEVEEWQPDSTRLLKHYINMGFKVYEMQHGTTYLRMDPKVIQQHVTEFRPEYAKEYAKNGR